MRCHRRILTVTWQDKVPNNTVLKKAEIPSMYTLLKQKSLRWLANVVRKDDGRIPKDLLYGELAQGKNPTGRPQLRYADVCKRDLNALGILTSTDEKHWLQNVQLGGRKCSMASLSLKRHLPNWLRQRDKRGRPEIREIDYQLTTSGHCAEGTVIPELVFPFTKGAVPGPPIRARHNSLKLYWYSSLSVAVCQFPNKC